MIEGKTAGCDESPIAGGKYVPLEVLGEGGMGTVYRAHHRDLDRDVAIKVLHSHVMSHPQAEARFRREAKLTSRLRHRNSVQILDYGIDDGRQYLVMEFVRGRTLGDLIEDEGALHPARAARIMSQVLAALSAAHDTGIVHRDMKPDNVMLIPATDDDGQAYEHVKVLDFGIAKLQLPDDSEEALTGKTAARSLTREGDVCGTPEFMAPEQAEGKKVDARTDIYACGVMLYQMLTGVVPFSADTPIAVMVMHLTRDAMVPSQVAPNLAAVHDDVVQKAMARSRDERYQTAREFRAAVRVWATDGGTTRAVHDTDSHQRPQPHGYVNPVGVTTDAAGALAPAQAEEPKKLHRGWWALAAGLIFAIGAGAYLLVAGPPDAPNTPASRATLSSASGGSDRVVDVPTTTAKQANAAANALVATAADKTSAPAPATPTDDKAATTKPVTAAGSPVEVAVAADTLKKGVAAAATAKTAATSGVQPAIVAPAVKHAGEPAKQPAGVVSSATATTVASTTPRPAAVVPAAQHDRVAVVAPVAAPKKTTRRRRPTRRPKKATPAPEAKVVLPTPTPTPVHEPKVAPKPVVVHAPKVEPKPVVSPTPKPAAVVAEPKHAPAAAPKAVVKMTAAAVSVASVSVKGSLPRSAISRAVKRKTSSFETCYAGAAKMAGGGKPTTLKASLTIDTDGRARDVMVKGGTGWLRECVTSSLKKVRTRSKPDTGAVDATFALKFDRP